MIETKFKQTELCQIPMDWDVGIFNDFLITFSAGATPYRGIPDNFIGTIPWITSGELNYCEIEDTREHISSDAQKNTHLTLHKPGTFLIAITGLEATGTRGRCAFVKTPATTNQSCLAINSTNKMTVKYLFWFYRYWSDYLAFNFSQGSKQQSFTAEIVKRLPLYAPKYKEQEKIAEALNDIDKLICELNTLIKKKRYIMQGAMQELLTARRRLPGFDEPWEEMAFKDFGYTYNGLSGKTGLDFGHGDSKFIMFVNVIYKDTISPNYFEHVNISKGEKQNKVQKNDLIFNTSSETPDEVGMCSCVTEEYDDLYLNSFCFGFRFYKPNINPRFLTFLLRSKIGRDLMMELAQGSTRYNLPKRRFLSSKILLPKDMHEQNEIALVLSDMNDEIEEIEEKREKYIAVRQGMMQQLLTGKIRLI